MKPIIIPALAALGLAVASPALAAPPDNGAQHDQHGGDHDKGHKDTGTSTPPHPGGMGSQTGSPPQTGPHDTGMKMDHHDSGPQTQDHGPPVQNNPPSGPVMHGSDHTSKHMPPPRPPKRYDWGQYQQGHTPPKIKNPPRLDFHMWQRNFSAPRHFHGKPYHRPDGWYYRKWSFGMVLPLFFWSQDYWIADYWDFDLPDPPYGYVWVRYGDDALLVNVRTGFILQVEYDLFD